jgi:hypothetical protein
LLFFAFYFSLYFLASSLHIVLECKYQSTRSWLKIGAPVFPFSLLQWCKMCSWCLITCDTTWCEFQPKSWPFVLCYFRGRGDCLCGLVVRVLGYRSGGPGSIPGTTKKKVVGLERGPLSLVSTTEELLDRKVAAPV